MIARRIILFLAFALWATITFLTLYVLIDSGPDVLVLISLVVVAVMGFGMFGALGRKQDGPP